MIVGGKCCIEEFTDMWCSVKVMTVYLDHGNTS